MLDATGMVIWRPYVQCAGIMFVYSEAGDTVPACRHDMRGAAARTEMFARFRARYAVC